MSRIITANKQIRREAEAPPYSYIEATEKVFDVSRASVNRGKLGRKQEIIDSGGRNSETSPHILMFQFNPESIEDVKRNRWEMRQYAGKMGIDPIWIGGDTRTITFTLQLDATESSLYLFQTSKRAAVAETYSSDGLEPRGVLPSTELLSSFQYPAGSVASPQEMFVKGMAKRTPRFSYPPDLIFAFGNYYITCKLTELTIKHTLFNKDLTPIRAEANVTLIVKEEETVLLDTSIPNYKSR